MTSNHEGRAAPVRRRPGLGRLPREFCAGGPAQGDGSGLRWKKIAVRGELIAEIVAPPDENVGTLFGARAVVDAGEAQVVQLSQFHVGNRAHSGRFQPSSRFCAIGIQIARWQCSNSGLDTVYPSWTVRTREGRSQKT